MIASLETVDCQSVSQSQKWIFYCLLVTYCFIEAVGLATNKQTLINNKGTMVWIVLHNKGTKVWIVIHNQNETDILRYADLCNKLVDNCHIVPGW